MSHGNPPPDKGRIIEPKRASDKVRKTEAGHPFKTGESVTQLQGTEAAEDAGNPQEEY
jgi:hypothetical protein